MFSDKLSFANISKFLKILNKIFIVCSVLLVCYIAIKIFMIRQELSYLQPETKTSLIEKSIRLIPTPQAFSEYDSSISKRNFFNLPKEQPPVVPKEIVRTPSAADLTKNIKVTGLMLTKTPQVILENQRTRETLILSIGDTINDLIIKDIQQNKLIFDYQGQALELAL